MDFLQQTNKILQKSKPVVFCLFVVLRGWREEGAPTQTYPDQREQSWASIYTCLPLDPQSSGSGGHFTQEKQIVKKSINKKKVKCPNPLLSCTTVVSQTFFIIRFYSLHNLSKKHADIFFFFYFTCLFPPLFFIKKKKATLKYFSKKYMANKTFRKPHNSTKDATGMRLYIYTTQKDYTVTCKVT